LPLTYAQVTTLALQNAKVPAFTAQANLLFQQILEELNLDYDLDLCRGVINFNFNPGVTSANYPNYLPGAGPYNLPADFLRFEKDEAIWYLNGVPYPMVSIDLAEYDRLVQQSNVSSYPSEFATDIMLQNATVPVMFVYPPPSGAFAFQGRYKRLMPTSTMAATDTSIPWFPNSNYLVRRLTGELCVLAGDDRASDMLGESPSGAQGILRRYLQLANDDEGRAQRITLDRRRFGSQFSNLAITKTVGW
jgi:hypothetical protein